MPALVLFLVLFVVGMKAIQWFGETGIELGVFDLALQLGDDLSAGLCCGFFVLLAAIAAGLALRSNRQTANTGGG